MTQEPRTDQPTNQPKTDDVITGDEWRVGCVIQWLEKPEMTPEQCFTLVTFLLEKAFANGTLSLEIKHYRVIREAGPIQAGIAGQTPTASD